MGWQDAQQQRRGTFQKEVDKEYEGLKGKKSSVGMAFVALSATTLKPGICHIKGESQPV